MLAIRMQRTGRKGHAQFRIIVQEARRTPTSGAIVFQLGHYNPHAKEIVINKEKADFYLSHGAQPSDSVARLLKREGVKLPSWVKLAADKSRPIRHADKLRKNRPAEEVKAPEAEAPTEAAVKDEASSEEPATEIAETNTEETTDQPDETSTEDSEAEKVAADDSDAGSEETTETA